MKNFDLKNYGVQEMNTVEMKEIDGGWELFGENQIGKSGKWYTVNVLGIPVMIAYRF